MKPIINSYSKITPNYFNLIEFTEDENEIFGSCVLIDNGIIYTKEMEEWIPRFKIHQSINQTIYIETSNRDLLIGKMHPEGFRILKIQDYFDDQDRKHPVLILEVFEEMLQEISDCENLEIVLRSLNINLYTK